MVQYDTVLDSFNGLSSWWHVHSLDYEYRISHNSCNVMLIIDIIFIFITTMIWTNFLISCLASRVRLLRSSVTDTPVLLLNLHRNIILAHLRLWSTHFEFCKTSSRSLKSSNTTSTGRHPKTSGPVYLERKTILYTYIRHLIMLFYNHSSCMGKGTVLKYEP